MLNQDRVDPLRLGPLHAIWTALAGQPSAAAVAEVLVAALVLVALLSAAGYALAYWNFRLTRNLAGTVRVSRGLLTTRQTTIEERRLRGVELSEPLLLRAVGAARCLAITTGLRVGRGAERGGTVLAPPIPRRQAELAGARVLGTDQPLRVELIRHGRNARRRRYIRALAGAVIAGGRVGRDVVLARLAGLGGAGQPARAAGRGLLAHDRYRNLGHALCGGFW